MTNFALRFIIVLIVIAGTIAYVGDYLGRLIGRKRITLFRLRPRYTAIAFTVLTGMLIALLSVGFILLISQDARTALFGLQALKKELANKSSLLSKTKDELTTKIKEKEQVHKTLGQAQENLTKSQAEIASLARIKKNLSQQIKAVKQEKPLFKVGDEILTSLVQAGPEKDKVENGLKQILSATDTYLRTLGLPERDYLVFISPENFNNALTCLTSRTDENIVKVKALENTLWGEQVVVDFEIIANRLIFPAGYIVTQATIKPTSLAKAEVEIKKLLVSANQLAKDAGVLPDERGSIGNVTYSQIYALAKKISQTRTAVTVLIKTSKNIYTLGPLEVEFATGK